jgi:hypothetical protein
LWLIGVTSAPPNDQLSRRLTREDPPTAVTTLRDARPPAAHGFIVNKAQPTAAALSDKELRPANIAAAGGFWQTRMAAPVGCNASFGYS